MARTRREPVRTCVGCRRTDGKRELVRLVMGSHGRPVVDPTGKAAGRGAYLHPHANCWRAALQRGSLARALRSVLTPDEAGTLLAELEGASKKS